MYMATHCHNEIHRIQCLDHMCRKVLSCACGISADKMYIYIRCSERTHKVDMRRILRYMFVSNSEHDALFHNTPHGTELYNFIQMGEKAPHTVHTFTMKDVDDLMKLLVAKLPIIDD